MCPYTTSWRRWRSNRILVLEQMKNSIVSYMWVRICGFLLLGYGHIFRCDTLLFWSNLSCPLFSILCLAFSVIFFYWLQQNVLKKDIFISAHIAGASLLIWLIPLLWKPWQGRDIVAEGHGSQGEERDREELAWRTTFQARGEDIADKICKHEAVSSHEG